MTDPTPSDRPPADTRVSRHDVRDALREADPEAMQAVLRAADVTVPVPADADALATALVDALWWRTHTPAGHYVLPSSLGAIVDRVARKLDRSDALGEGDAWHRLAALTDALLPADGLLELADLDEDLRARLRRRSWLPLAGTSAAGTAAGSRLAAKALLKWTTGPVWRLVPLIPRVGPIFVGARTAVGTVAAVTGPVGVGLALLSLNATLGAEDDRALPLLIGVGLLLRPAPFRVADVDLPVTADEVSEDRPERWN